MDVHDPGCPQKPWRSLGSMFPLVVKFKEASFAIVAMTADIQTRKGDRGGFWDNPYSHRPPPPKVKAYTESHQAVLVEIVMRKLNYSSL